MAPEPPIGSPTGRLSTKNRETTPTPVLAAKVFPASGPTTVLSAIAVTGDCPVGVRAPTRAGEFGTMCPNTLRRSAK
ncbi:hypothetical protein B0I08_103361 [Glaciihabitans tibetensis]|uniref:Uncharacterized protein n=1 Tax=Glaciihabitans tibetensis TaxID=1266600 RepID=A0A2T0VGG7_9MICO|nr:hypothetical protein B0I08_103361 [Glaciihabitans tibetensis]